MRIVEIVWFKEGDSNTARPPYMSVWRYGGEFYQVFWPGEDNYKKLVPVLNLLPYTHSSFNSQSYRLEEAELASILGDDLGYVTSCDSQSAE